MFPEKYEGRAELVSLQVLGWFGLSASAQPGKGNLPTGAPTTSQWALNAALS